MSAAKAIMEAHAAGIRLDVEGDNLVLAAALPPPAEILDLLSRHKSDIIVLLRPGSDGWSREDWQAFYDERAGIAEFDGGQSREQAEATAFECCVVEWLDRHRCLSNPGRCAACGTPGREDHVVVPFGTESHGHTWLHPECWEAWHRERQEHARRALVAAGLPVPQRHPEGFQHVE